MEKELLSIWNVKSSRSGYAHTWQSRLLNKIRRDNEVDKGNDPPEKYNSHIHAPNVPKLNFKKQTLLDVKPQIDSNTIIVDDCNAPFSQIDGLSNKKNQHRNFRSRNILAQMDLITFTEYSAQQMQNTYSSQHHKKTFSKIDHIIGH
jgi:hypothetical protein